MGSATGRGNAKRRYAIALPPTDSRWGVRLLWKSLKKQLVLTAKVVVIDTATGMALTATDVFGKSTAVDVPVQTHMVEEVDEKSSEEQKDGEAAECADEEWGRVFNSTSR